MANQMIALGVRGPQLPNLGNMAQQFANTMAATATARERRGAAERQMQFRQLVGSEGFDAGNPEHIRAAAALDPAGAEALGRSFTTRRAADQDFDRNGIILARELSLPVRDDPSFQRWLQLVEDNINPEWAAMIREASPTYNQGYMTQLRMAAADYVNKSIPTPTATAEVDDAGVLRENRVGGILPPSSSEMTRYNLAPTTAGGGVGGPDPEQRDPAASPTGLNAVSGETPGQMMDRGIPAANVPMGDPTVPPTPALTPASAGGGMGGVQPLDMRTAPQIIQNAIQNRVIDEMHVQQLRAVFQQDPATAAQNERALAEWMRQHQIRIQPTGEAPMQPGMRSAEYRPDMGPTPQFQQVQATAPSGQVYVPAGRATGRSPLTSPSQDPNAARGVAEAQREPVGVSVQREAGTTLAQRRAEAETEGPITTSRARAERLERLRGEAPKARGDVDAVLSHTSRRVNAIDRLLDSRAYESIVGPIEGRIPTALMTPGRANAQRLLDTITNTDVLQDIISARGQTETGGSPLGNVSNSDLQLYIRAANELEQAGDENEFREALLRMRRELIGNTARTRRTYTDTFRELGGEMRGLELTAPPPPGTYVPGATRRATRPAANRPAAPATPARGRERTHSSGVRILGL
jgi:hypothetical protein